MPAPLPDSVRTRACELGRTLGLDLVVSTLKAEGHKVGRATVGGWLKEARQAAQVGQGTRPASKPVTPPAAPAPVELAGDLQVLEQLDRELGEMLTTARNEGDARLFATLIARRVELRKSMQAFRPPPKIDPDQDPTSLEARAAVRRRIEKMIENAELATGGATHDP